MTSRTRIGKSVDGDVPPEVKELERQLKTLFVAQKSIPNRTELDESLRRVIDSVKRRRRILSLVQEALSQLRLDVKYLMFDLEVTRRERDELKERLEELERGF